jgi:DNA-binding protein Fis
MARAVTGTSVLAGEMLNGSATLPVVPENHHGLPVPAYLPAQVTDLAGGGYEEALDRYDRALVAVGLSQCDGRVGETARLLGISRNTLRSKINSFRLTAGALARRSDAQAAGLDSLREEDRKALCQLRAQVSWAELKRLPAQQQKDRFKTVLSLQTQEMFEVVLADASAVAPTDPRLGEERALVAHALAGMFPRSRLSNDLQAAAMGEVATCRRLAGDRQGATAAFNAAQAHLKLGLGEPAREARLLSIHASLASDTGHPEQALAFLERASALYRKAQDSAAVASVVVKEANTLMASCRHEEGIAKAEEALRLLAPKEARLEMLARNIITECLAYLGRPAEALRSLVATLPLIQQFWGLRTEFQLAYLEALVLDALGFARDAETAFRTSVRGRMEAGLYKDAFLTLLTRFERLVRRGSLDEAARACEEAIEMIEEAGEPWHAQTIELWRDLLSLVNARRLTEHRLLEARHCLVLGWAAPRPAVALELPAATQPVGEPGPALVPEPPAPPSRLAPGDYEEALARYDRELIAAGLAQCQGRIGETCRLLGISRTALVAKMKRYGLRGK